MSQRAIIYPDRITIIPLKSTPSINERYDRMFEKLYPQTGKKDNKKYNNLSIKKSSYQLSNNSKRQLMRSVNNLAFLSQPRNIVSKKGKVYKNFRIGFITLTLPSRQIHSDTIIKKKCLDHLFQELRTFYSVKNYVWKAELQRNGNIHFHIFLDKYVDYNAVKRRWNRIVNKLGYVDRYSSKMSELSLLEYARLRGKKVEEIKEVYAKGCKNKWKSPNSVDCKIAKSSKEIGAYMAKYLLKDVTKKELSEEDIERIRAFGKFWSRSQSLSKLKHQNAFLKEEIKAEIDYIIKEIKSTTVYFGNWFTVIKYRFEDLPGKAQEFIRLILYENAKMYDYPFPYIN